MFQSFGFEIIVQPALYLAALIAVLVVLFKGSYREHVEEDGVSRKGRRRVRYGAKRRALLTLAGAVLVLPALVITPPGHRAAIYNLGGGVSPNERMEGLSLVIPWVQSARMVSVRTQVYEVEVYPQSLDLQEVTVPVAVNYHIKADRAAELYQGTGFLYEHIVISPAVDQFVGQEVGLFRAIDFARNRAALAQAVALSLEERLAPYGIVLESVNVRDAVFAIPFRNAVEAKIIAEQQAEQSRRLIEVASAEAQAVRERAAGDRDAAIARAEGDQAAIEKVAAALGFTPLEYLEWVRLGKWDGALPKTVLGSDSSSLIFDVGAAE